LEKEQNYFILNKYSEYWDLNSFDKNIQFYENQDNSICLKPESSYRIRKNIDIDLEDTTNKDQYSSDNKTEYNSIYQKYFIDYDGYHFIYVLDKWTKNIKRINIDYFKDNNKKTEALNTTNTNFKINFSTTTAAADIFNEWILNCQNLENPQMFLVKNKNIYILDNTKIHVFTKAPTIKTTNFLQCEKKVHFFAISDDEQILFISYSSEKNKIYKRKLWPEEKGQQYTNNKDSQNDFLLIIDLDEIRINNRLGALNNSKAETFIDMAIDNKSKYLIILTQYSLYTFDFKGNQTSSLDFQQLDPPINNFNPFCIAFDDKENEIVIGSESNTEFSFTIRIKHFSVDNYKHPDKEIKDPRPNIAADIYDKNERKISYEFLRYNGKSYKIFFSSKLKGYYSNKANQNKQIIIITNIISKENLLDNKDKTYRDIRYTKSGDKIAKVIENNKGSSDNQKGNNFDDILKIVILDKVQVFNTDIKTEIKSKFLDILKEDTQWDKIRLDQQVHMTTDTTLKYYCSNSKDEPNEKDWILAPKNANIISLLDCKGRYLKVKINLSTSDENISPKLKKLYIYFLPKSYLQYLPSIYQQNDQSKVFLERFLAIFQNFYEETEIKLNNFIKLLDTDTTFKEFLPWLSSWLAITNNNVEWTVENKRLFLKSAPDLFKKRGTREGLEQMISIYLQRTPDKSKDINNNNNNIDKLSDKVDSNNNRINGSDDSNNKLFYIVEFPQDYEKQTYKENIDPLSKQYAVNGTKMPYHFYVLINPFFINEIDFQNIKQIVEEEKPAHTVGIVSKLPSLFVLGNSSYLGINTILQKPEQLQIGFSILGLNSFIGSVEKERK
jgi:phage tail-like protein